ncbi:MAG TPA: hypothetical protein V6D16_08530 [Candidatus Obscuribacterales bacterium]
MGFSSHNWSFRLCDRSFRAIRSLYSSLQEKESGAIAGRFSPCQL